MYADELTLPSITATQELVVPRSIPIISFPDAPLAAVRLQRHILFVISCVKEAFIFTIMKT